MLGRSDDLSRDARAVTRHCFEVELLIRATDWHVQMSHAARKAFEYEHIQAASPEEAKAKAKAADMLLAFRAKCEAHFDSANEGPPALEPIPVGEMSVESPSIRDGKTG
jgi:hypothetical protein